MIPIPELTPAVLAELGRELGGCDFTDANQVAFLDSRVSCDVQAAPGNGKTTLLVAKLALLSRSWVSRQEGVCVISHTNAAREEVEKRLHDHRTAFSFLNYPHFVGTVTAFVDQFIALPYLRGLGWTVRRIDDEVFGVLARKAYLGKPRLVASARARNGVQRRQIEAWVSSLELAPDFQAVRGVQPTRLAVQHRHRQPRAATSDSGVELEELKAELVSRGVYRFGDMTALAIRALDATPHLADRIRARFPLVMLDEAQDTNGAQLALLERLFGNGAVAYQRLGDQNQTLYGDDSSLGLHWQPQQGLIPLNQTRRFGSDIASLASRLTVRVQQQIDGLPDYPSRRTMMLFDENSILRVLPAYGEEVVGHFGADRPLNLDIRAVASRHSLYGAQRGSWPRSLIDYCPEYRSGAGRGTDEQNLCGTMRHVSREHAQHKHPHQFMAKLNAGIVDFLDHHGVAHPAGSRFTATNVWKGLAGIDRALPTKLRELIVGHAIKGAASWGQGAWDVFIAEMRALFGIDPANINAPAGEFCAFANEGAAQDGNNAQTIVSHHGVDIRLGSIHSVKGRTADGLLLVETEVFRSNSEKAMDLSTVLPKAFGISDADLTQNEAHLSAATNVFVAVTRPRSLLVLAMRKNAATAPLLAAVRDQGWLVRDLTQ